MRSLVIFTLICGSLLCAADAAKTPWDLQELSAPPVVHPDPSRDTDGVKAFFYDGLPFNGKPTRVFAYYAAPPSEPGKKVPAMVLVHGGGGSAYIHWVKLWVSRGYAAIAMDTSGQISDGMRGGHTRHEFSGPGSAGGFDQMDDPLEDHWTYHAVADVILAHSLIRSFPEVDAEKIGLTGISWGSYLGCIVSGVDHRFKFYAAVYGCGFLPDNSAWLEDFQKMGPERTAKWRSLWDPSIYLVNTTMPVLWVTGTNDAAFPMDSFQKSYRLPKGDRFLTIRPRMEHAHGGPGENPEEIHVMANAILKGGPLLPKSTLNPRTGRFVSATFRNYAKIVSATLNYTTDTGVWKTREWKNLPANFDHSTGEVTAEVPEGTSVYYFNIEDDSQLVSSSEHEELVH